jgi:FkbM family methyltransferase
MTFLAQLIRSCNRRRSEFFRKYLSRIGKLRISHATGSWGYNLFDDLDKLESPRSFQTIIDVGANRGEVTQLFLRHFPNAVIHAFEPVELTFMALHESLGREPRVTLHQMAAADVNGTAIMRTFAHSGLNTMVHQLQDGLRAKQIGEEKIETCRLDLIMDKFGIKKVDLLKIDVEGFERSVLLGCRDYLRPEVIRYIFFECHTVTELASSGIGHTQLSEINSLLTASGYRFITLYTEAIAIQEPIGSYNALYGPLKLRLTRPGAPLIG